MSDSNHDRRKSERKPISTDMEFILYLDAFKAETIDLSNDGIKFKADAPIIIQLQYSDQGEKVLRHAKLVWAEAADDDGVNYGFEFIPDP